MFNENNVEKDRNPSKWFLVDRSCSLPASLPPSIISLDTPIWIVIIYSVEFIKFYFKFVCMSIILHFILKTCKSIISLFKSIRNVHNGFLVSCGVVDCWGWRSLSWWQWCWFVYSCQLERHKNQLMFKTYRCQL